MLNRSQVIYNKLNWPIGIQVEKFVRILRMNLYQFVVSRAHDDFTEVALSVKTYQQLIKVDALSHIFKNVSFEDDGCTLCHKPQTSLECPSLISIIEMEVSSSITIGDRSSSNSENQSRSPACDSRPQRQTYGDRSRSYILDHPIDMIEETLISTKSMMIDIQTIDLEVVISSIKINMIIPDTMAIGMGDHNVIHLKGTIIDNSMVMKAITPHKISGRATKIETKEGLAKAITNNMVIKARIEAITMATTAIREMTVINLETNITMSINKTITIITGQGNHNCQICQALSHKMV